MLSSPASRVPLRKATTAYLHAIGPQKSEEMVGKLGNSASPADSLDSGLGIKELAPGISLVVE